VIVVASALVASTGMLTMVGAKAAGTNPLDPQDGFAGRLFWPLQNA
jgi:hypothetical protein